MKTLTYVMMVAGAALSLASAGCGDNAAECGPGTVLVDGLCIPGADACEGGTTFNPDTNKCEGASCATGTVLVDGECLPDGSVICETGTTYDADSGTCVPDITGCATGTVLVGGICVPEDETLTADVEEPAEPNGFGEDDVPGQFTLPAAGGDITLHGCINPHEDLDMNGNLDVDFDAFVFQASGPTLLDITADGVGGLAAGFVVFSAEENLSTWERYGINLVGDMASRQVFLPEAGVYVLAMTDSRSLLADAAGSPDACYYTTISTLPLPTPTPFGTTSPVTGSLTDLKFYSYQSATAGGVFEAALDVGSPAAVGEMVYLKSNAFQGTAQENTRLAATGLATTDTAVYVVDYIYNYALVTQPFDVNFHIASVTTDPGDGSTVTLTHDEDYPVNFLSFEGTAGDVIRIVQTAVGFDGEMLLYPPGTTEFGWGGFQWIADICYLCSDSDTFVQLQKSGTYYLSVENYDAADADTYTVAVTRHAATPSAITIDTPQTGKTIGAIGADFYVLDANTATWLRFALDNLSFTGAPIIALFDRAGEGELGNIVGVEDALNMSSGPLGRIVVDDDKTYLVAVVDDPGFTAGSTYDISISTRTYTNVPSIAVGTPYTETATPLAADDSNRYFVATTPGRGYRITATGSAANDLELDILGREENSLAAVDDTFTGETETYFFVASGEWTAFTIEDWDGTAGSYDLTISAQEPISVSASPASTIPDDDLVTGLTETVTLTGTCASIAAVSVDVDITHSWRGDLDIYLTSPDGTTVQLWRNGWDPTPDLVGSFPGNFTPFESLDVLADETALGTWTLELFDVAAPDEGTLNSWGVNVFCN